MKKAKLNRSEKVKKECLTILFLKDDDIDLWPWNFGCELSSASIQNRVKNAANLRKSIATTQFAQESWLKSSFSEIEWSELTDVSKFGLNLNNFSQPLAKIT
ncbi:hypothetical protein C2G38_2183541 [Gigaspora rosea]|uniref:Uncharacterized protein n=1 Tax=Gigaspora rosea TaxID=44941 RepID=A0A397VA60_9GLOM|nr:hypothetical protein C2G38_2183541 [Gigaspora rosea]